MGMKCIGVDVGGTSVKIGLFEVTGELLEKWEVKTRKEDGGSISCLTWQTPSGKDGGKGH